MAGRGLMIGGAERDHLRQSQRAASRDYGPHKTLYTRWKRWGAAGVFARMMEGLSAAGADRKTMMIDVTYLKARRTASSLAVKKGDLGRLIGRTKGGMNTGRALRKALCQRKRKFRIFTAPVFGLSGAPLPTKDGHHQVHRRFWGRRV
jgi:predicted RNA-binding protein YlqC (UPF0109 family)